MSIISLLLHALHWFLSIFDLYFKQLDPQETIPKDFIELNFDEEVLKHTCPEYLKDTKDEDVSFYFI